ncbi:MAG TPA: hypothetical protein DDY14_12775 [Chromatiaceae bacterium]|nr:hypothetical protein [Chromatiaceae bacterium]
MGFQRQAVLKLLIYMIQQSQEIRESPVYSRLFASIRTVPIAETLTKKAACAARWYVSRRKSP